MFSWLVTFLNFNLHFVQMKAIFGCSEVYNACSLFLQCLLAKVDIYDVICSLDIYIQLSDHLNFPAVSYSSFSLVFADNDVSDKSVAWGNEHVRSLPGLAP